MNAYLWLLGPIAFVVMCGLSVSDFAHRRWFAAGLSTGIAIYLLLTMTLKMMGYK